MNPTDQFQSRVVRWVLIFACISVLAVDASCTDGSSPNAPGGAAGTSKGNQAPVVTSAKILSDPIVLTGPVAVQVVAEDPEREAVSFHYQWFVDDAPLLKQTKAILPAELLRRGQAVMVEITPTDGTNRGQPYKTKPVVVGNTSPKITSLTFVSQVLRSGEKIQVQVEADDPDHDRVDLAFKWFRNGTMVKEGEEPFLDTVGFVSGDRIAVEVVAQDPEKSSSSLMSDPLVLGNSAPTIVSSPPAPGVQDRFEYAVRAVDLDGDKLTYQLETAPPGMTITESSGQIAWSIPADQQGTFRVKVVATDGHGGMATQEFDLTLTTTNPAKPDSA